MREITMSRAQVVTPIDRADDHCPLTWASPAHRPGPRRHRNEVDFGGRRVVVAGLLAVPARAQAAPRVGIGIVLGGGHRHRDRYDSGPTAIRTASGTIAASKRASAQARRTGIAGSYNFWNDRRYRNGDSGYKRRYGPKHKYVAGFRRGYEEGYRRAYAGSVIGATTATATATRATTTATTTVIAAATTATARTIATGTLADRVGYYRDRNGDRIIYERPRW